MKYTRLSLRIVMVFVSVFAATSLFYVAPRQAMAGPSVVSAGTIMPHPAFSDCAAIGPATVSCVYQDVGLYVITYTSTSLSKGNCVVSPAISSLTALTASQTCAVSAPPTCDITGRKPYQCVFYVACTQPIIVNPDNPSEGITFQPSDVSVTFICVH